MMTEFKTVIDFNITGSDATKSGSGTAKISWKFEIEMREFGVKDISIYAPDQTVTALITRYNDETDEEEETEEIFELKDIKIEGYVDDYSKIVNFLSGGIYPKELELWKNTVTLSF
jgi:hypothetical protein